MKIFVGNLNSLVTERQLERTFADYGVVRSVKIINDAATNRPKGFAFVEMGNRKDGERAIEKLNNTSINQQRMTIYEAKPEGEKRKSSGMNRIYNMPVNIEHVKTIEKGMNGFQHALVFRFNEDQSFEWRYRNAVDRNTDYERLMLLLHTRQAYVTATGSKNTI
jgi:RNA recognition motif-containing protein